MTVQSYTVSSASPIPIFPAGLQLSQLIRNSSSANHVFLSNDASGVGFDLGPGSSISWDAGKPLYASVLANLPVTLTVLDSGGPLFDASAIAAQISVSGAPPVDVNVILAEATLGNGGYVPSTGTIDVSKYQSVHVAIYEPNPAQVAGVPNPRYVELDWWPVIGTQLDTFSNLTIDSDAFTTTDDYVAATFPHLTTYRCPVRAGRLSLTVGSAAAGVPVYVAITGSYKTVSKPRFRIRSSYWGDSGKAVHGTDGDNIAWMSPFSATLAAPVTDFPHVKSGLCTFTVSVASVATQRMEVVLSSYQFNSAGFITPLAELDFPISATQQTQTITINVPNYPLQLQFRGTGAVVVNAAATLVFTD